MVIEETLMPETVGRQAWLNLVNYYLPGLIGVDTVIMSVYKDTVLAEMVHLSSQLLFFLCILRITGIYLEEQYTWTGASCTVTFGLFLIVRTNLLARILSLIIGDGSNLFADVFTLFYVENPYMRFFLVFLESRLKFTNIQQTLIIFNILLPGLCCSLSGWLLNLRCPLPDEVEPLCLCCTLKFRTNSGDEKEDISHQDTKYVQGCNENKFPLDSRSSFGLSTGSG